MSPSLCTGGLFGLSSSDADEEEDEATDSKDTEDTDILEERSSWSRLGCTSASITT